MKKYIVYKEQIIVSLIIGLFIIPTVTFASWWNPLTWNIFNNTPETKIETINQSSELEKLRTEIEELKKKNITAEVATKTPSGFWGDSTSQISTGTVIVKKKVEVKAPTPSTALAKLSNAKIIEKIKPAIVYVETTDGAGSGMIIESNKGTSYVLTNAHVVEGFNSAQITLTSNNIYTSTVIGRDENVDLALLKIDVEYTPIADRGENPLSLPVVKFGNSDILFQGDEVFTLGFPFGIKGDVSFKEGTVSRKIDGYIETSAEIHPGNSGGPLVNKYGQVVGINTLGIGKAIAGVQVGETIKLAIPINTAKSLLSSLKSGVQIYSEKKKEDAQKAVALDAQCKVAAQSNYDKSIKYFEEQTIKSGIQGIQSSAQSRRQQIESNKQAEISRINSYYNPLIQQATRTKESDLNIAYLRSLSSGLSGSPSGAAQQSAASDAGQAQVRALESQKYAEIARIESSYNSQLSNLQNTENDATRQIQRVSDENRLKAEGWKQKDYEACMRGESIDLN